MAVGVSPQASFQRGKCQIFIYLAKSKVLLLRDSLFYVFLTLSVPEHFKAGWELLQ